MSNSIGVLIYFVLQSYLKGNWIKVRIEGYAHKIYYDIGFVINFKKAQHINYWNYLSKKFQKPHFELLKLLNYQIINDYSITARPS